MIDGLIGLRAGVGLDVGVICAEERFGALDGNAVRQCPQISQPP
jgi:hypothetical protein